ncbi:thymidine kinase [Myxococcota bacterium]|nr:thymidine kinase [Myxococcota bacterium]
MQIAPRDVGWIEVITGCMFSGKTEELIRRLRRATFARQQVAIFKPRIDDRYSQAEIVSHSDQKLRAYVVEQAAEIPRNVGEAVVVGVDEAQFFGPDLVAVCEDLANGGRRVIVAGLDQDYRGQPFEPMPTLMAVAEYVTKNLAICMKCGNPADRSQRIVDRGARVLVGATESYEARCRKCFVPELMEPVQTRMFGG